VGGPHHSEVGYTITNEYCPEWRGGPPPAVDVNNLLSSPKQRRKTERETGNPLHIYYETRAKYSTMEEADFLKKGAEENGRRSSDAGVTN